MNQIVEIAMFTDHVAETTEFYARILDAAPTYRNDDMAIFQIGPTKLFIHRKAGSMQDGPPNDDHIAIGVANVNAADQAVAGQGIKAMLPPKDYYWGRSAYYRDPDGRLVEINKPGE